MGADTWDNSPNANDGDTWKPDSAAGDGWKPDSAGDGFTNGWGEDPSTGHGFSGEFTTQNISKHANGEFGRGADSGCRICGGEGHFARDCPDKKDNSGECYNCGEVGHNKADCPNPRVEREFSGTCRLCDKTGHRAKDCPDKPPQPCKVCGNTEHITSECTVNRLFAQRQLPDVDVEEAWKMLEDADTDKDVDDIRNAILAYAKAYPKCTFPELEGGFRSGGMNTHIIAKQQAISNTHTIVNLAGEIDQKYVVSIQFSDKPRRPKFAEDWPSSPEENMERLSSAGFVMDRMVDKCHNCGEIGHISKNCPEEKVEKPKIVLTCANCNAEGHLARDCKERRRTGGKDCRHCGETGHIAKDCPTKEPEVCRNCGEEGHRAKDCTQERKVMCHNCDAEGHVSRDCPEPKDPARMKCRNCDEKGHSAKECPQPRDWSRVTCTNCGEKGHGRGRCPQPEGAGNGDGGWEDNKGDASGGGGGGGGWGGNEGAASGGGDSWGGNEAAASGGGDSWGGNDAGGAGRGW